MPSNLNLKNYILQLDNWIPKNICEKSIKELSKNKNWERHTYTFKNFEIKAKNGDKELDICYGDNLSYLKEIHELTFAMKIRFNRYKKGQIMSKHQDHITSLFTGDIRGIPILSIVAVLNENYTGGEFIMFDDYEIKFKTGDVIIFPSIFLYPHLVKPVKKGTRYSFVSWCY